MKTFVALFRGINVGGKNLLPMKELIPLLEQNNCHNVQTYIQTGNVVFQSDKAPNNLGGLISNQFGFTPDVMILTEKAFLLAVANNPYPNFAGKEVHFYFCKSTPTPDIEALDDIKTTSEHYRIIDNTCYLHAPDGIGRSKLVAKLEKLLGVSATGRNLNTVNKLVTLLDIDE